MQEIIKEVANFIIEEHTIEEAAKHFGKSESSIKKYLSKVRNPESEYYDEILSEKLKLTQAKIILMGRKKGGTKGKRGRTYTLEEQMRLAKEYLGGKTLSQVSDIENIPTSTLHENIRNIQDSDLQEDIDNYIYNCNLKGR